MFKPGEPALVDPQYLKERGREELSPEVEVVSYQGPVLKRLVGVRFKGGVATAIPEVNLSRPLPEEIQRSEIDLRVEALLLKEKTSGIESDLKWVLHGGVEALVRELLKNPATLFSDWRGHFKDGKDFTRAVWGFKQDISHIQLFDITLGQALDLKEVFADPGAPPLPEPIRIRRGMYFRCPSCGNRLQMGTDGRRFYVMGDPCEFPKGFEVSEWELNVPSGKLVVANDLRDWYPIDGDFDIETERGLHETAMAYAEAGMSHAFVGNTCPGVYRERRKGSYSIKNSRSSKNIASICTDLWWYSLCDYEDLKRRGAYYTPDNDMDDYLEKFCSVVDVKPGVYRFRHYNGVDRDEQTVRFADFKWVREPEPYKDFISEEEGKESSVEMILAAHMNACPSLFLPGRPGGEYKDRIPYDECTPKQQARAVAQVADHLMCTLGNGVEWHPNGFPRTRIPKGTEPVTVPSFGREHWYPFSGGYGVIPQAAGIKASGYAPQTKLDMPLAPGFVLLALNICQSIISYGQSPRLNMDVWPPTYMKGQVRHQMHLCAESYRALRKKYPNLVWDKDFDAWMNEWLVKEWIERFDLGPDHPPKYMWPPKPKNEKTGEFFEFELAPNGTLVRYESTSKEFGDVWYSDEKSRTPRHLVGRVVGPAEATNIGSLLEVTFDYGTDYMRGTEVRFAIRKEDLSKVRQFDDPEEYQRLLGELSESP